MNEEVKEEQYIYSRMRYIVVEEEEEEMVQEEEIEVTGRNRGHDHFCI